MKNVNRTEVILRILSGVGLISVALLAPNALQSLGPLLLRGSKGRQKLYGYRRLIQKLNRDGLIEFRKNHQGILCASLTKKGNDKLDQYEFGRLTIPKPAHWDRKYRIIIFDIKEWKRGIRDELRNWLIKLGFRRLQNSVWVYPFECEEIISLLKTKFKIGKEVLYITADKIENDSWLRKEFGLLKA